MLKFINHVKNINYVIFTFQIMFNIVYKININYMKMNILTLTFLE